ncbi:alpha/beta hydrolase [Piscinibacter sakaiensis]|uniref:Esterase/lipase n=1 Tax=Piscinibacter sakaiensis TaxID=1547922 RepID=A0A0K8P0M7_PISS1|nr:alpha/beta hydrolase fold domain-containing protein [Piscinibacter sakaiensis]GAP36178.1 esterase/lipase [Piscinibacter sakaiensis]
MSDWLAALRPLGADLSPAAAEASMALAATHLVHPVPPGLAIERDHAYGPHPLQRLDVFRGPGGPAPRAGVLFVHGGGFVGGDKRERPPFHDNVGWWAVRHSRIGLTLNHRLAPAHPWPAAMDDLDLALQAVQAQAAGWGLDPQRLLVVGHSAGAAHVAAWLARRTDRPVERALLVSGLYDWGAMRPTPGRVAYTGADAATRAARSPAEALARSTVPLVFAVAELDPPENIEQAQAQLARQQAAGTAPARLLRLAGHNHFSSVLQLGAEASPLDAVLADGGAAAAG